MNRNLLFVTFLFIANIGLSQNKNIHSFQITTNHFEYDGKPINIYSGELHYARIPKAYWRHRLRMVKALGLNTITTYVFWNYHETNPGVWDFKSESRNIREFVSIAQQEGLFVILRPGPYVCAEWEFGGYPWWLQKNKDLEIRTYNKPFLDSCKVYLTKLSQELKGMYVSDGGPIIMVQAENEFGSYVVQRKDISIEQHKLYNKTIKNILEEVGLKGPYFTSDGSGLFNGGTIPGVLPTANGENDIDNLKKKVNEYNNGKGPYMVAEFYPGWLDHWDEPFQKVSTEKIVAQTQKYLQNDISFNYYMVHGGTNFGFTSGSNYDTKHDIQPDLTSYDYDALISEAGWVTPKYSAIRELFKKNVSYSVPEIPQAIPVISIPPIKLTKTISLLSLKNNIQPTISDTPLSFEDLNQGHGYVLYSKKFTQPISGTLKITGLRDYATVYVNAEKVGELNRQAKQYEMEIDIPFNATVDILVENMGRINYGAAIIHNKKGIISPITINNTNITSDWEMYKFPFDKTPQPSKLPFANDVKDMPTIYFGNFNLTKTGDTFLDMQHWGKGLVFVNGHNLGRFWKVGPQQTLYLPGVWLKKGKNEIVIFDQLNPKKQIELKTLQMPILDNLNQ